MLRYRSAADRPFRRVILESGSPTARSVLSASHPRTASQFADLQTRVRALGGLTRPNVTTAGSAVWARGEPSLQWPFQPVVAPGRESIIPATPLQQWSRPGLVPPPVLTGFCSHEGTTFFPGRGVPPGGLRGFFGSLIPGLDLDALERVYSRSAYPDERRRVVDAYSHHAYICPAFHTAHAASGIAGPRAKVYLYEFAAGNTPGGLASHCAHGPVLRPPGGVPIAPGLADVGAAMMGRWERFIFTPDQDGDGRPDEGMGDSWPVFRSPFTSRQAMEDPTTGLLLVFGGGNDEATGGRARGVPVSIRRMTPREMDVCRFWWDHMHLSQGMGDP